MIANPMIHCTLFVLFYPFIVRFFTFFITSQLGGQITVATCNFSGECPTTFGDLRNLPQLYTNLNQTAGSPLLIKMKDVQSTKTMTEALIKLQSEVMSFARMITDLFFAFNTNIGWFIYVESRFS